MESQKQEVVIETIPPNPGPFHLDDLPEWSKERLCKIVIAMARKLFEDPAIQEDYKRWEVEYDRRQAEKERLRTEAISANA